MRKRIDVWTDENGATHMTLGAHVYVWSLIALSFFACLAAYLL